MVAAFDSLPGIQHVRIVRIRTSGAVMMLEVYNPQPLCCLFSVEIILRLCASTDRGVLVGLL
eukprot:5218920-Amphidinium_carterae.1